jgi:hypothetical protein
MKVLLICILIFVILKKVIKENYNIWKSNPYIKYGRYNLNKLKKLIKKKVKNKTIKDIKRTYSVVYLPNNQVLYDKTSGNYTKL